MTRPSVLITNERGIAEARVYRPGLVVEIRDYDIEGQSVKRERLWKDENGRPCIRTFVQCPDHAKSGDDLERFVDDLHSHTGIKATFERSPYPDGLHVLRVKGVDFYFGMDGKYDGWGRKV